MTQNRRIARNIARTRMHAMGLRRVCSKGGAKQLKRHYSHFSLYWREYV